MIALAGTSWEWVERFSWIAALLALAPVAVAVARRKSAQVGMLPSQADAVEAVSVAAPADQPGGAVNGRNVIRGREALLRQLAVPSMPWRSGDPRRVWVLHGLGGTGKTTVAWALTRHARRTTRVWWVSATDPVRLSAGMRQVAAEAGGRPEQIRAAWARDATAAELVWRLLAEYPHRWLLVLDNADRPEVLEVDESPVSDGKGWLRPVAGRRGRVIVTSRDGNPRHFGTWCRMVPIRVLAAEEAARLLIDHAGPGAGGPADARALAERLGGLPLAVRLTGSYLAAVNRAALPGDIATMAGYLRTMDDRPAGGVGVIEQTLLDDVRAVWLRSLDHLAARGVTASRPLLHPLVRAASRLDAGEHAPSYLDLVAGLLQEAATQAPSVAGSENPVTWPAWQFLAPHAFAVLAESARVPGVLAGTIKQAAVAAIEAGRFLRARGFYAAADYELRGVAQACADRLGPQDRTTLAAQHHLGRVSRDRAEYAQAESCFRQVLEIAQRRLGARDRATISARHELARVLYQRGEFAEAEIESRRVLELSGAEFGADDTLTLASRYEHARVLAALGRLPAARSHFAAVYEIERRKLGDRHPDILNVRHELAKTAYAADALSAAERDLRDVRLIRAEVLGREHPQTLAAGHDLALVLARVGRLDEARNELAAVWEARTRVLGADHPDTRGSAAQLLRLPPSPR